MIVLICTDLHNGKTVRVEVAHDLKLELEAGPRRERKEILLITPVDPEGDETDACYVVHLEDWPDDQPRNVITAENFDRMFDDMEGD
jgi:hypothetical protein